MLIPCNHAVFNPKTGDSRPQRAHVFYSDDHGDSWQLGGDLEELTDECTAIEGEDGSVYLNMRSNAGKNRRAYAWSRDGGITWTPSQLDESMIEPVCEGSVIRYTSREQHGGSRILFSNPASLVRERMTVKLSYDECKSWPVEKVVYPGLTSYSDLAVGEDMSIYCAYEYG
jgi:sialidase-1